MFGEFALDPEERPARLPELIQSWFIVSRCGDAGEYLTFAIAEAGATGGDPAPAGLRPILTRVGVLLRDAGGAADLHFALLRELPPRLEVAGRFRPAHGLARLVPVAQLTATGQDPGLFRSWRIAATRRPWAGTFIEGPSP